jgi:[acyl-carrier-protein] S-malonyltransferase
VRFDLCLATIGDLQPSALVELAPAGTLAALAKRALPAVPLTALKAPSDLPVHA